MSQLNLTAVDSSILFYDLSVPQDIIDASSYTMTFAHAHARTVNSDASSNDYFTAMTQELELRGGQAS